MFVGRRVHFEVSGDDFYSDLLFFHAEQLRYFVIELKTGKSQTEDAGKPNFYVTLVDDEPRSDAHNDTVGITQRRGRCPLPVVHYPLSVSRLRSDAGHQFAPALTAAAVAHLH